MSGAVKLLVCTSNSSEELITGTVAHLDVVVELLKQIAPGKKHNEERRVQAIQLVEASKARVTSTYYGESWTEAHTDMLRIELLTFFIRSRVKVTSTELYASLWHAASVPVGVPIKNETQNWSRYQFS